MKERNTFDSIVWIKTIDVVVQSALLVFFVYSLDEQVAYYKTIFYIAMGLQLVSWTYNSLISYKKKLKKERLAYLILILLWIGAYVYIKLNVKEQYFTDKDFNMLAVSGMYDFSLLAVGVILMGWYSLICFREIKGVLKKQFKD